MEFDHNARVATVTRFSMDGGRHAEACLLPNVAQRRLQADLLGDFLDQIRAGEK